jgi:hypothetical protein
LRAKRSPCQTRSSEENDDCMDQKSLFCFVTTYAECVRLSASRQSEATRKGKARACILRNIKKILNVPLKIGSAFPISTPRHRALNCPDCRYAHARQL